MLSRVARQKNAFLHLRRAQALRGSVSLSTTHIQPYSGNRPPLMSSSNHSLLERVRRPSSQAERHLATAADYPPIEAQSADSYDQFMHTQFEGLGQSSLVILDSTPQSQSKIFRRSKGVGGDETEMMANLDVSLKIGQFDRAAALIARLAHYHPPGSPEYLALHNRYLKGMVGHMILARDHSMVAPLQKWFEVDMPATAVVPDATTYALMLRVSLRMLHGARRERTVRRYWELAQNAGVEEELVGLEVLEDSDVGELSKICSSDMLNLISKYMDFSQLETTATPDYNATTDDTPEVNAANLKGLGLSSLRQSMASFGKELHLPATFQGTEEEAKELLAEMRQRQLETDSLSSAIDRWRQDQEKRQKAGLNAASDEKKLSSLMSQWHTDLVPRIKREVEMYEEGLNTPMATVEHKDRCEYGVFLKAMDADRLAAITILSVLGTFSRYGAAKGIKLSALSTSVGREVQEELIADAYLAKTKTGDPNRLKAVKEFLANRRDKEGRLRWRKLVETIATEDSAILWGSRVQVRIGTVLIALLLEEAKVPVRSGDNITQKKTISMQPAFSHAYTMHYGRRSGLVHMHQKVVEKVAREPLPEQVARHLPMISKPKPWIGHRSGGYLIYQNNIVRSTPGEQLQPAYLKAVLRDDGMKEIRAGLDVLSGTGWKINKPVFDVMLEAWNDGGSIGNLAPLDPKLEDPEAPGPDADYAAQRAYDRKLVEIENLRSGLHSVRCFQNFQMEVARAFRNDTFYLPHNMDFRGRAYPLPPYLNQMGADNARGLLLFDGGKALGATGLRWLKIHIANLFGFDKASMSERAQFTMDNLESVLDSANKGLHGQKWWLQAEDPWQLLAACIELRNAMLLPDPTQYVSHLPIHQDGSCNGLQHYAALGGDKVGAQQVNLEPSDRPSDVYTGVCEFVKESIAIDAAEGQELAMLLNNRVTRKIVKQTVMTNVYGVTFLGATRQVKKQLVDYLPDLDHVQRSHASFYIARKIFGALGSIFNGAHEIQHWLGDCAHRITVSITPEQVDELTEKAMAPPKELQSKNKCLDPEKAFRSTVIWTTPLGLPVVQPYRSRKSRRVQTSMQDISILDPSSDDVVQRRKQLQAFPPNFIHSLDATHMILSANACHEAGLSFSAVHDSFWTHAADIDQMNLILRDAFVRMHSDNVVGRLASEFNVRYGKNLFLARINRFSDIAKAVMAHRSSCRQTKMEELIQEKQRQFLLQSSDPEDQAEGRAMVTPSSIFEAMGGGHDDMVLTRTKSHANTGIGHIPEDLPTNLDNELSTNELDTTDPAISSLVGEMGLFDDSKPSSSLEGEDDETERQPKKQARRDYTTWLWMPLTFRPIPKKGDWDVTRIRESEYFFS
ncbi:hypothetical protein N7541_001200 [Penicillium brevicompactum]|uniref:DNA-directed RNA polymerase n=1 Tax=Penicillium brevicompactum TaxID=5074 RepID=A0A9W9RXP6_PENBR|nr:hypothetical protein N7541_001200 [Penicillium brevicompactum]